MAIDSINAVASSIQGLSALNKETSDASGVSFKQLLTDALNDISALEQESNKLTEDFIAGKTDNIASVLIAGEKASISLSFVMEIRNKIMESYQEIMRMQV